MTYIETNQAPELRHIIRQIEQKKYSEAIAALKNLQSGIDWNWCDCNGEDEKPYSQWSDSQKLDGEIFGIINSLHMAHACGKTDTHFAKRAVLQIKVLIGEKGAGEALDILTTTAAVAAEKELEQYDQTRPGGGKN